MRSFCKISCAPFLLLIILMCFMSAIAQGPRGGRGRGCPPGEVYIADCRSPCEPTCREPNGPQICVASCRTGCFCRAGLLRRERDNRCVNRGRCSY
uniref:U7-Liphistoxin-Lth1a_1 n=2 Tax=Liphistius TaxID=62150 RepID=A0A4Q8K2R7_9ARAC